MNVIIEFVIGYFEFIVYVFGPVVMSLPLVYLRENKNLRTAYCIITWLIIFIAYIFITNNARWFNINYPNFANEITINRINAIWALCFTLPTTIWLLYIYSKINEIRLGAFISFLNLLLLIPTGLLLVMFSFE